MREPEGYEALLALDRRIHRFVYRSSKNEFLAATLDHYHNLSLRILQVAMRRYPALTPRLEDSSRSSGRCSTRSAAGTATRPRRWPPSTS